MTRVSENSQKHALNFAVGQTKQRLEDLQMKGATLKNISKPSDNPMGNVHYLNLNSRLKDGDQFLKNITFAKMNLEYTEDALTQLSEILNKAKEIAIAQSSDLYNDENRENVAQEVIQIRKQALAIANRRLGNKYIFSGFSTLTRPFNEDGKYHGDQGKASVEISKDFFLPVNLHGDEVFYARENVKDIDPKPLAPFPEMKIDKTSDQIQESPDTALGGRDLASITEEDGSIKESELNNPQSEDIGETNSVFGLLDGLIVGLKNSDASIIRDSLEKFDASIDRVTSLRTKIGALVNSIYQAEESIESEKLNQSAMKSKIADADIAELYSELTRQQHALMATYKSSQGVINKSLLDFLR